MKSREIKTFIIAALGRADGQPLPMGTLASSVRLAFPHLKPANAEVEAWARELEAEGYLAGLNDDLLGLVWSLTPKGQLRAQQL